MSDAITDPTATITMKSGYRMIVDRRVAEQEWAFQSGVYDRAAIDCFLWMVPKNGVFLDIGANVGFYACAFGCHCRAAGGRVYAFEPVAANAARLRENIALNDLERHVTLVPTALGERPGILTMHRRPEGAVNNAVGGNMLSEIDRTTLEEQGWSVEETSVQTLDDWARSAGLGWCDAIKIDIEGADLSALRGGMRLIEKCRPLIVAEFSPYWMKQIGQDFEDVRKTFDPLGYAIFREVEGKFLPITSELIGKDLEAPTYLLAPKENKLFCDWLAFSG